MLAVILSFFLAFPASAEPALLGEVPLLNAKGEAVKVSALTAGKLTVFVAAGTGCPVVRKYAPTLNALRKKWDKKGVRIYLVGEAMQDDNPSFQRELRDYHVKVPAYFDPGQELVRRLGLDVTSKVAVVSAAGEVLYAGAIDDQYGSDGRRPKKPTPYLDLNLQALAEGRPLPHPKTQAAGCAITLR